MFTPEEALLGSVMTMESDPAELIAERAGVDPKLAARTLKDMARHGLVSVSRGERAMLFALLPFVVGSYEAQLPRMDAQMAALFEEYFLASKGMASVPGPSVHRVLPVGEAVANNVEIHPYEQAAALVEAAKSWGVRPCICRTQQHLLGKGCDAPIENCMVFAPVEGAFDGNPVDRAITKDEALRILREAEQAGLVHSVSNHRSGQYYICNCCTCCCGVLRRVAEFSVPTAIARSAFLAVVDEALCIGCGACEERCQFGAI
ncbi:MAG: 4Fe-4S binding protein, partial [Anaerolineae bacterium]|nr:4Fe-4S binding protein [Anaerolineae bacterium]